jgi:hypothetical protein
VPAADDAFVSFAQLLRAAPEAIVPDEPPPAASAPPEPEPPRANDPDFARDVRVFRARLADAFDASCDPSLGKSARAALAREIDAVLAALLERAQ